MTYSFSIIPVIALLCYTFQLISLLTAKRNSQIDGFMGLLLTMIIWTGGSWFMRMGYWPSVGFWFHVSLTGLLTIPLAFFIFLRRFMEVEKTYHIHLWLAAIVLLLVFNYKTELLLKAPEVISSATGDAYVYDFSWPVIFFFICAAGALFECARMARENGSKNAFLRKQLQPIWLGLFMLIMGNSLILCPLFKGVPIDICSGIFMAGCLYYALYKKRLFKLDALMSKANCYCVAFLFSMLIIYRIIPEYEKFLLKSFSMSETKITIFIAFTVSVVTILIYMVLHLILDKIFEKEVNVQSKSIVDFSKKMSNLMSLAEILSELMEVIADTISSEYIYIFLKDKRGDFQLKLSNAKLFGGYTVSADTDFIRLLKDANGHMLLKDYMETSYYWDLSEEERKHLLDSQIECFVGIGDEKGSLGIILLSAKSNGRHYTQKDVSFLSSINSVASIAIKNSSLYETAYEEARKDYLTGVSNRKCFYETMGICCTQGNYAFGALLMINVDDFKLYNQLYGDEEGDEALKRIAKIIQEEITGECVIARFSGKEFAVLLPERTTDEVKALAEDISLKIREMNHTADKAGEYALKALTVSCGIATGVCPLDDYHELINQANMAVYYAKQAGKNRVMIYKEGQNGSEDKSFEMTYQPGIYSEYSTTIYALTAAIDAKDHYTFSHSENVAYYSRELAKAYGMNEEGINVVYEAGLLHDIGKIGINEEILNKPGKLTEEEYEVMKTHVSLSIGIIRHLPSLDYVIPAVIGHHERYDGQGYPRGIGGKDIPLMARILCIADSFDAMVSKRSYKEEMAVDKALHIITNEAGRQFDPQLAPIFVNLIKNKTIEVR